MYGKLIDGLLIYAPKHIAIGDVNVWNASSEQMISRGWLPIVLTQAPKAPEGYYYESGWEEQENAIVQTWTLTELPDDIDEYEAYRIIMGEE